MAEPYLGPVARMRAEMERERAAVALGGSVVPFPEDCAISVNILRQKLLMYPSFETYLLAGASPSVEQFLSTKRRWRPWRVGTDMVGPDWLWKGVARVLNDADTAGLVQVWTRKTHKAWRKQSYATTTLAAAILRGEVKDPW